MTDTEKVKLVAERVMGIPRGLMAGNTYYMRTIDVAGDCENHWFAPLTSDADSMRVLDRLAEWGQKQHCEYCPVVRVEFDLPDSRVGKQSLGWGWVCEFEEWHGDGLDNWHESFVLGITPESRRRAVLECAVQVALVVSE